MLDASINMHASYTTCMIDDDSAHKQEPLNHDVSDDVDFGAIQTTEQNFFYWLLISIFFLAVRNLLTIYMYLCRLLLRIGHQFIITCLHDW